MTSPNMSAPGLRTLSADLLAAPSKLAPKVLAVVKFGANTIKRDMIADFKGHVYFGKVAYTINYDVITKADSVSVEIGPNKGTGVNGGNPGPLANIAYFGTSRGGGTVRDPQHVLDEEGPRFEAALGALLEDIL